MNLPLMTACRCIYSAKTLLGIAGDSGHTDRRIFDKRIQLHNHTVVLRNQRALHPNAVELPTNCSLKEYVGFLNERVFFWPGTSSGPIAEGIRLLAGHPATLPAVVIRIETKSLIETNEASVFQVATCNTGAAWLDGSKKSRRSFDLCCALASYTADPGAIIEISLPGSAILPGSAEYSVGGLDRWTAVGSKDSARGR